MKEKQPLFVAMDMGTESEAYDLLEKFPDEKPALKVGMELFYTGGPTLITKLKEEGHDLFLDLKCHDIPKTVERTMNTLARYDVDVVTLHATGGKAMMEAAMEGLVSGTPMGKKRPVCVAVTALTSTSATQLHSEMLINRSLEDAVHHFTTMSLEAGLDGVVCSVQEVSSLRKHFGEAVYTVTPGIRLEGAETHDQKRAATPEEARRYGSNAIVVGRAITGSSDPKKAYDYIQQQWTS